MSTLCMPMNYVYTPPIDLYGNRGVSKEASVLQDNKNSAASDESMRRCIQLFWLFRENHLIHGEVGIQVNDGKRDARLNISSIGESIDDD